MKEVVAFSPGHITGFFQICDQAANPLLKGSRGAGVSIAKGVTTRVYVENASKTSFEIKINDDKDIPAQVSRHVIDAIIPHITQNYKILVNHEVSIPIGAGLGSSGAGGLSLALALNKALDLGLSWIEAAQVAHIAEIECKTGLGTVLAETYGGVEIRTKPGAPGVGEIVQIPVSDDYVVVCLHFGPISTKMMLSNDEFRERINKFGGMLLEELVSQPTLHNFMEFSRNFAEKIEFISRRMRTILDELDSIGISCSIAMFGELLFSLVKRDVVNILLEVFRQYISSGCDIIVTDIDFQGARLL